MADPKALTEEHALVVVCAMHSDVPSGGDDPCSKCLEYIRQIQLADMPEASRERYEQHCRAKRETQDALPASRADATTIPIDAIELPRGC